MPLPNERVEGRFRQVSNCYIVIRPLSPRDAHNVLQSKIRLLALTLTVSHINECRLERFRMLSVPELKFGYESDVKGNRAWPHIAPESVSFVVLQFVSKCSFTSILQAMC